MTSGIDGVYPAGLSVARVINIESATTGSFDRVVCQPVAGMDRNRYLLILLVDMNITPRPTPEDAGEKSVHKRYRATQTGEHSDKEAAP